MVLCNVECAQKVCRYLDVTPGQLHLSKDHVLTANNLDGNKSVGGFGTIIQALAKNSKCSDILGSNKDIQALTQQWLEYAVVCANYASTSTNAKRVLTELNTSLKNTTYITGTSKTLADIVLYYILHSIMRELNYQEKAHYVHVSRWFDNMQQEEKLRQNLDVIHFNILHTFL